MGGRLVVVVVAAGPVVVVAGMVVVVAGAGPVVVGPLPPPHGRPLTRQLDGEPPPAAMKPKPAEPPGAMVAL